MFQTHNHSIWNRRRRTSSAFSFLFHCGCKVAAPLYTISQQWNIAVGFFTILILQPTATEIVAKNGFFSFFWISIDSMQKTNKHFFTLAAYKLHALCVNKSFPVQPLPLIILPLGFEEWYWAGRLSRTYEHFHLENILPVPRQLMVWRAHVLPEYWRLLTFHHKRALNRQTEGSGLAQSAACLSGRQSHFNKLQYAYDSHKMITFKKMHCYALFP